MEREKKDVILRVSGLKTRFRVDKKIVNAVNGVDFELRRGKTLCVVGESGCGKSVTAHTIMQLLPKTGYVEEGTVDYFPDREQGIRLTDYGRNSRQIRQIRGRDIAMIFQDPMTSLNPVYTVGSQIVENLRKHEMISRGEAGKRVVKLLQDLGIPEAEKRFHNYPHQFSGGMRQRVMIAIAMVCNPRILIADEPTTALDVTIQAQILDLMGSMQQEHHTSLILITHNMGIVAEVAHDIAVMYMGRVVEFGRAEQVFEKPLHPYTQALMRSVPVLGMPKNKKLETIEGSTPDASTQFTGCEFANRCRYAGKLCYTRFPLDTVVEDGHRVRCIRYEEGRAHE